MAQRPNCPLNPNGIVSAGRDITDDAHGVENEPKVNRFGHLIS